MKYAELDTCAKEKAKLAWEHDATDTGWWDHTYGDAMECAKQIGIEIGEQTNRTVGGKHYLSPDISFSGFWNQGDGCSFSGRLIVTDLAGAIEKVKAHAPQDETLAALAVRAEALHGEFAAVFMADRLADEPQYPEVSMESSVTIKGDSHRGFSTKVDPQCDFPDELEDACNSFVQDFASWIYDQLEKEHEHLTSDESFKEWIESCEPDFDEDGDLE